MSADLLAHVERPVEQRPVRIAPLLPDLESTAPYWHGPAGADAHRWRVRAESAEKLVDELRRALGRYRIRP